MRHDRSQMVPRSTATSILALFATGVVGNLCRDFGCDCCANFFMLEPATCATGSRPTRQPATYDSCPNNYQCETYASLTPEADSSKCRDSGNDCCANLVVYEWATCAEGYHPSHQPLSWNECPNYTCLKTPEGIYPNTDYSNTCAKGKEITSAARCKDVADEAGLVFRDDMSDLWDGSIACTTSSASRGAHSGPAARILSPQRACQAPQQHGVMPHPRVHALTPISPICPPSCRQIVQTAPVAASSTTAGALPGSTNITAFISIASRPLR